MADKPKLPPEVAAMIERQKAEWKEPKTLEFEGPGPFELPLCGEQTSFQMQGREVVVLQLETQELHQRVLLPISTRALRGLQISIDHLIAVHGLGGRKN